MNKLLQLTLALTLTIAVSSETLKQPTSYSGNLYKEMILDGNYNELISHHEHVL